MQANTAAPIDGITISHPIDPKAGVATAVAFPGPPGVCVTVMPTLSKNANAIQIPTAVDSATAGNFSQAHHRCSRGERIEPRNVAMPAVSSSAASARFTSSTSVPATTRAMLMPAKGLFAIPKVVVPPVAEIVVVDIPVPLADDETMLIVAGSIWIDPPASV